MASVSVWTSLASLVGAMFALAGCSGSGGSADGDFSSTPPSGLRSRPAEPSLSVSFTQIELGYGHTCGLATDARAFCMGDHQYSQLGSGSPMRRCQGGAHPCSQTPLLVDGGHTFVQLGLDQRHSCGLTAVGEVYCWGFGEGGQLGDGLRRNSQAPVRAQSLARFRHLGRGQASGNLCAIDTADQAWCWGPNLGGALGDGTTTDRIAPVRVASSQTFASLSAGGTGTCGLTRAGRLLCWGTDSFGQLGFEPGDP